MKVCITHVKTFKKPEKHRVKSAFIDKLIDCGMPEDMANELMNNNRAIWQKEDVDASSIYAAEVLDEPEDF